MFLRGRQRLLFGLWLLGKGSRYDALEEVFEDDNVLEDLCDGPAIRGFAEVPLVRRQAGDEGQHAGFAGGELVEDELALVGMHGRWMM